MRKFYMLFIALFVSGFVSLASAQSYPPTGQDCGTYTVLEIIRTSKAGIFQTGLTDNNNANNARRYCMGLPLQPAADAATSTPKYGALQRLTFNEGINFSNYTNYPCYNNLTWLKENGYISNDSFTLKVGQTLCPTPVKGEDVAGYSSDPQNYWDGAWMPYAIYVDYNIDNSFSAEELVSARDGNPGHDAYSTANSFRAGTTPGTYRYRVLTGTDNTPQGLEKMVYNGGMVADAYITLVRPTVKFVYNSNYVTVTPTTTAENLVCGEDYTFTIAANANCQINSVVARIGDESVYQDVTLASSDGTYTVPASQFQNDMVITINATKTSTLTAADAADGNCYFRLKSNSGKYLKCGISTATASSGEMYVQEGNKYLYTWDPTDATEKSKQASYIWRLVKDGSNTYMVSQGYRVGAIGTGADVSVQMSESGKSVTCSATGSKYTFTTNEASYNNDVSKPYLHEVSMGRGNNNDKYPNNDEGLHVSSWTSGAAASQWTIEPIEYFDITIGAGGWSSFNYAFPIAFATSQVSNVYISTSENTGVVTLVPIPAKNGLISVPSNTPIFVEGVEGTVCTVELLTTEPTVDVSANTLRGTTLPKTASLTAGETAYVIATPADKETALYKLGAGVKIPSNKAYYVSGQSQTSKLELNFGEVTEISNAVTAQPALKDEILYDLRGHRVVYPTRGIYVTGSGRKIFIK